MQARDNRYHSPLMKAPISTGLRYSAVAPSEVSEDWLQSVTLEVVRSVCREFGEDAECWVDLGGLYAREAVDEFDGRRSASLPSFVRYKIRKRLVSAFRQNRARGHRPQLRTY